MFCFVRLLLLFLPLFSLFSSQDFSSYEDLDDKTNLFNVNVLRKIDEDIARFTNNGRLDQLHHKIGVLAVYFRLFKEFLPMDPTSGYKHIYPSEIEFHSELAMNCSSGLDSCLNYISAFLRKAQPWLTGQDGAAAETELTRERMRMLINDNAISLELSASQVLCWMTMREVSIFEHIPFCAYNIDAETETELIWPGKLFYNHLEHIDEMAGKAFECAKKSFCPDPCCHDVNSTSLQFTERECHSNTCKNPQNCYIQSKFNDDLQSQRENRWNISCPCTHGMFFRPDVAQCVHENICAKEELCAENEECLNVLEGNGYKCICQLGYTRRNKSCIKYGFSRVEWSGPALTEQSSSIRWLLHLPFIVGIFI